METVGIAAAPLGHAARPLKQSPSCPKEPKVAVGIGTDPTEFLHAKAPSPATTPETDPKPKAASELAGTRHKLDRFFLRNKKLLKKPAAAPAVAVPAAVPELVTNFRERTLDEVLEEDWKSAQPA